MKAVLTVNLVAVAIALYLAIIVPYDTDLEVALRYTYLDRAGAINNKILGDKSLFHPSLGFSDNGNNRYAVPQYIAQPATYNERFNAYAVLVLAVVNATTAWVAMFRARSARGVRTEARDAKV